MFHQKTEATLGPWKSRIQTLVRFSKRFIIQTKQVIRKISLDLKKKTKKKNKSH